MSDTNPHTLLDAMQLIVKTLGPDILADGNKMLSAFTDLAPQLKRERNMLKMFVDAGGSKKLYAVKNADFTTLHAAIKAIVHDLNTNWGMDKKVAENISAAYYQALTGKKLPALKNKTAKEDVLVQKDRIPGKKPAAETDPVPTTKASGKGPGFGMICFIIWMLMNVLLYLDVAASLVIPMHILSGLGVLMSVIMHFEKKKKK